MSTLHSEVEQKLDILFLLPPCDQEICLFCFKAVVLEV